MVIEYRIAITIVFLKIKEALETWEPDPENAGKVRRKYKYIILTGSSRSSKTRSLIQYIHEYGSSHSGKRMSVWRPTKKECRETVGKDIAEVFPMLAGWEYLEFNETNAVYTFPNKSVFEIQGTDDPKKVHGYNGHVIWLNEPYDISRDTFDQLDQRTEDFVVIDWNPLEAHWIDDLEKDSRTLVIHSTFRDNPYCPTEQKAKILSYQPVKMCHAVESKLLPESEAYSYDVLLNTKDLTPKQIKELLRCRENERKNSASLFKWMVYGLGLHAERPNRIFFWEEVPDHVYHALDVTKYYGHDWGVVDPWGIIEAKYYDGALYFHELNYNSENQIRETLGMETLIQVQQIEEGLMKWRLNQLNLDKKAYHVCDNNQLLKIKAMIDAGYQNTIPAFKPAGSILSGINILLGLKCYYTQSSTNIKNEQQNYSRVVDKYGIPQEEPEDKHNHLMDPSRYIAIFLSIMGIIKQR